MNTGGKSSVFSSVGGANEAAHISDRPQEQDYSSADETAGTAGRVMDEVEGYVERRQMKKARRRQGIGQSEIL